MTHFLKSCFNDCLLRAMEFPSIVAVISPLESIRGPPPPSANYKGARRIRDEIYKLEARPLL